ncbi:MAG: FAD-dependent monooxygenase [Methylococcaceae bacterium]
MKDSFDVVIVGGGMVGATLACALGGTGLTVALLENQHPTAFAADQPHDLRVSALSIASKQILASIGAWEGVLARRLCPFRRMRVWETAGDTEFCSDDIGAHELGFIVENRVTQLALWDCLQRFDNIELICPAALKKINYSASQVGAHSSLELADGRQLAAKVLVAADGGQSRVREAVGLGVTGWDYKQHALVVYVETQYGQQDITWQRFVPSGPQAFLPLSGHYASLVWYNSPDEISRLKSLSKEALLQALMATFPDCLGQLTRVIATANFPLKRQHAQSYVKSGVALVGDAAHSINPLAGQGANIGFLDAAALAEVLVAAHKNGQKIDDIKVLKTYEKMRRAENLKMMTLMDAFYQVFSNQVLPLKFLRNLGLGVAERVTPLKTKLMRSAMGLDGNLPKLARGLGVK